MTQRSAGCQRLACRHGYAVAQRTARLQPSALPQAAATGHACAHTQVAKVFHHGVVVNHRTAIYDGALPQLRTRAHQRTGHDGRARPHHG